jgi:ABC-2 type transport system ATP-binding protein
MKQLAADGRTVLVSSHLMNEMAVTADHLIVIGQGRLLADCPTAEFIDRNSKPQVLVKSPDTAQLTELVTSEGAQVIRNGTDVLTVTGMPAPRIAELAARARVLVYELTPQRASLEKAFLEMTAGSLEFGDHGSSTNDGATTNEHSRSAS